MNTSTLTCPVCGTSIEYNDVKVVCPSCKIVFHKECWQENKGCSTYGCKYVNVLSPPMKVDIPQNKQIGGTNREQTLQQLAARLNRGEIDQVTYQRIYAEIMSVTTIHSPQIIPTSKQQKQKQEEEKHKAEQLKQTIKALFQLVGLLVGLFVGGLVVRTVVGVPGEMSEISKIDIGIGIVCLLGGMCIGVFVGNAAGNIVVGSEIAVRIIGKISGCINIPAIFGCGLVGGLVGWYVDGNAGYTVGRGVGLIIGGIIGLICGIFYMRNDK